MKVCVFTGSRADYGPLSALLRRLHVAHDVHMQLLVTGTHLVRDHGYTIDRIRADGFDVNEQVNMVLASDSAASVTKSLGLGLIGYADALERLNPDVLVVFGDRYEAIGVSVAAVLRLLPIAHIAGGQLTEGAVDDSFRHGITKLASLHFTSTTEFRRRILQLGEPADRVHVVGALGLDIALNTEPMDRRELGASLGLSFEAPTLLVTYHPATADPEGGRLGLYGLLDALDVLSQVRIVFTSPNADADGHALATQIKAYVGARTDRAVFHPSLGQRQYLSLLHYADAVVGNSSSGLVEAPAMKTATVNIGRRQDGRPRAQSVVDCGVGSTEILNALVRALSPEFQRVCRSATSPYGDGHAAERIVGVLRRTSFADLRKGPFVDLEGVDLESGLKRISTGRVPASFAAARSDGEEGINDHQQPRHA